MKIDWQGQVADMTNSQNDFLRLVRSVVAGVPCIPPPQDWAQVLELVRSHMLEDFLYVRMQNWPAELLPCAATMQYWRQDFLRSVLQYEQIKSQFRNLVSALHKAGIRTIPMKGIRLAERIYDDGACRLMNDIDLLVEGSQLDRAVEVFADLNYATADFNPADTDGKHIRFVNREVPLPVELHWRLWRPRSAREEQKLQVAERDLWERAENALWQDIPITVFPLEFELAYLCHHILRHDMVVPIKALLDLALFCGCYGNRLNTSLLQKDAETLGIPYGAKFILQTAADIFGSAPFKPLEEYLRSAAVHKAALRAAVVTHIQLSRDSMEISPVMGQSLHQNMISRLATGFRRIWIRPEQLRVECPAVVRRWGLAGGYLWRCGDLIKRHRKILFSRSKNESLSSAMQNSATRHSLRKWIASQDG